MNGQQTFASMTDEELRQIILRIENHDPNENWLNREGAIRELHRRAELSKETK